MATILEISAKSHYFFVKLLFVLFVLFAVLNSTVDPASNLSSKLASESGTLYSADVSSAASKTAEFHPRKRENSEPRGKKDEFIADDKHEVPSGPNPISN